MRTKRRSRFLMHSRSQKAMRWSSRAGISDALRISGLTNGLRCSPLYEGFAETALGRLEVTGQPLAFPIVWWPLPAAISLEPRDLDLVNERVLDIAADALRVVRAMAQAGELSPLPSPTADRLPGLIHDFAPNIAGTWIGSDDPLGRYADELIGAAERYAASDPKTVSGSAQRRLSELLRVVGLAAYRPNV
jgi:hypothetical protein